MERLGRNDSTLPGSYWVRDEHLLFQAVKRGKFIELGVTLLCRAEFKSPCSRLLFQITPFSLLWLFRNRPYVLHNRNKFPKIAAAIRLLTPGIVWFILVCVRKRCKPISLYETEIIIFLNINQEMDSVHITWGWHSQPLSSACQWMYFLAHSLLHSESCPCPIWRLISLPSKVEGCCRIIKNFNLTYTNLCFLAHFTKFRGRTDRFSIVPLFYSNLCHFITLQRKMQ